MVKDRPTHHQYSPRLVVHVASIHCLTNDEIPPMQRLLPRTHTLTMTVLLKNLFTVHFQFDLLKLETNNTRDDKMNHAWIIAR